MHGRIQFISARLEILTIDLKSNFMLRAPALTGFIVLIRDNVLHCRPQNGQLLVVE